MCPDPEGLPIPSFLMEDEAHEYMFSRCPDGYDLNDPIYGEYNKARQRLAAHLLKCNSEAIQNV